MVWQVCVVVVRGICVSGVESLCLWCGECVGDCGARSVCLWYRKCVWRGACVTVVGECVCNCEVHVGIVQQLSVTYEEEKKSEEA